MKLTRYLLPLLALGLAACQPSNPGRLTCYDPGGEQVMSILVSDAYIAGERTWIYQPVNSPRSYQTNATCVLTPDEEALSNR